MRTTKKLSESYTYVKRTALSLALATMPVALEAHAEPSTVVKNPVVKKTVVKDTRALQEQSKDEVTEEVLVKGFRRSLSNAIDVKRHADTVVEVVSADDIGGLPDVSIADALARLPGVSSVLTGRQAGAINISARYEGKYLDDTLGIAFGYSRLYQPVIGTQFVGLAYSNPQRDFNGDGADETVVDFQTSYAATDELDIVFQINNLTDEPTKTYFPNQAQTGQLNILCANFS